MNYGDAETRAPEPASLFDTTHWSVIGQAQGDSHTALNHLFILYRQPMIVHLMGKGYAHDQSEELVQGFCAHLLRRDFLANVAQFKGKFRTFLLTALDNYLRDLRDREGAKKRGEGKVPDSLDEVDTQGELVRTPASGAATADLEYDKAWAQTLLQNSLQRLEKECAASGHISLCRALEPVMFDDENSPSYREIAARLEMSEGAVKTAAHRLRQRLRGVIREEILQTVNSEAELEEELAYLISLFGRP